MFRKKQPLIEFIGPLNFQNTHIEPKPASHFFPDWFKKLEAFQNNDSRIGFALDNDGTFNGHSTATAKKCIPLRESLGLGYMIPLWADLLITVDKPSENGIDEPAYVQFNWGNNSEKIEDHNPGQLGNNFPWPKPLKEMPGGRPWKFQNPWTIKTPPGYSILVTPPLNRHELLIHILSGVVDTDTYHTRINFPFILDLPSGQHLIKQGTPIAQIFPFKREEWNSHTRYESLEDEKTRESIDHQVRSIFKEGYRKWFWSRKKFN